MFDKDLEWLFECSEARRIDLNLLYSSKQHHDLVVSKHGRCKHFLTLHHPADLGIVLSEVLVGILLNESISIINYISEWCSLIPTVKKRKETFF